VSCCPERWLVAKVRAQGTAYRVFMALSAHDPGAGNPLKDEQRLPLAARVDVALEAP
jgi:hypothetical protein